VIPHGEKAPETEPNVPIVVVEPARPAPIIQIVRPIQPVIRTEYVPVVVHQPEVERKPEEKSPIPAKSEEKTSKPEEKSSDRKIKPPNAEESASGSRSKNRKGRKFNGAGGRIHSEAQIDQILDWYLETGELPDYVSDRQRYDYRHHIRLPERRELLDKQQTASDKASGGDTASGHKDNITHLPRTGTHHS
jgi:outer membrane biosynthesis protein TonB